MENDLHTAKEKEKELDFFFQAEDGIRDKLVTGVQTCALPIYIPLWVRVLLGYARGILPTPLPRLPITIVAVALFQELIHRSEERRVGKECRSRWWWSNQKKK